MDYAWLNTNAPTVIRSDKVFGQTLENHVLCQIMTSGRYFAAFYGTICKSKENYEIDIIDIFDRSSGERVRRLDSMPAKPDILRIVEELGVFLLSYPGLLSLEIVSISFFHSINFLLKLKSLKNIFCPISQTLFFKSDKIAKKIDKCMLIWGKK